MRIVDIMRGGSSSPINLKCGDKYDSLIQVYENDKIIYTSQHLSTIPSRCLTIASEKIFNQDEYPLHGVLADDTYAGIWTNSSQLGNHFVLFQSNLFNKISNASQLTYEMEIFNSVKNNPSMNNKMKVSQNCIHSGGYLSNFSEGCLTFYPDDFIEFQKLWKYNDKVYVNLTTMKNYQYPILKAA